MLKKYTFLFTTMILLFSLLVGCSSDDNQLKLEVLEAISKQDEISSYRFSGSSNLQLDWAALTESRQDPLTAGFTAFITNSHIQWQGAANKDTAEMEVDLSIKPHQSDAEFNLPAMIKDNKLYFNIPLLTISDDEYLFLDLDGDLSNLPFASILTHIAEAIDEKFYEEINENEEDTTKTVAIPITQENLLEIIESLQTQFPLIIRELENRKLINTDNANEWRLKDLTDKVNSSNLESGIIRFTINQEGFITEQKLKLNYANQTLEIDNRLHDINQDIIFEKEIPEQTRSFHDIMNMLKP